MVLHTTIYLTEAEHSLLAALPARELRKTRHRIEVGGRPAVVDVLCGPREGLILLEVGFAPDESPADFSPPAWVGAETSLSGGELPGQASYKVLGLTVGGTYRGFLRSEP